jgi:methylamine--corrinoid protein Co-methyltransferase
VGTGIVASSAEIARQQVTGYACIPQTSSVSVPALNRVRGMPVIAGSPLEIHAAVESVEIARAALTHAGRPGLPILNLISSATSAIGTLGGSHPQFGLRASDGWLIDILAEMRVDFGTLNRLSFLGLIGGNVGSTALPILGGYGGGPAGTAVLMTAYVLLGPLLFRGAYHLTGPIHFRHGCSTTRDCLWVFSAVGRTTSLKARYPCIALGYAAGGAGTEAYAYESAAVNLVSVLAGYAGVQTVHPGKAVLEDGVSPLEARFNVEVADAALALAPAEAGPILLRIIERYEARIEDPPQGKRYQDWHDLECGEPREVGVQFYKRVKGELHELGLPC